MIYEAFTPSGTEAPDHSHGLYTGDPVDIRNWVSETSLCWEPTRVRLVEKTVIYVLPESLTELGRAKKELIEAKARLDALLQGMR